MSVRKQGHEQGHEVMFKSPRALNDIFVNYVVSHCATKSGLWKKVKEGLEGTNLGHVRWGVVFKYGRAMSLRVWAWVVSVRAVCHASGQTRKALVTSCHGLGNCNAYTI